MTLTYAKTPQLHYGGTSDNWRGRYPADMQPLHTCPHQPVYAIERNGHHHYAVMRGGVMKELGNFPDWKTRAPNWRETGRVLSDAIGWRPIPARQK